LAEARRLRAQNRGVAVVVRWLHRLGRQVLESVRCREEFKKLGVPIHSTGEGGEVSDFVANIMASVAEFELDQLSDRIVAVWDGITSKGCAKTTRAPWGYYWRPATDLERAQGAPKSVLAADATAAPYVKELFDRVASGVSIRSVQPWITTLPATVRGARNMSRKTLNDLLRSPVYIARPHHGDTDILSRPPAKWPALVSDETWTAVNNRLDAFSRAPRRLSNRFLLTGFIFCPACGGRMRGQAPQRRYRCGGTDGVFEGNPCWQTADMARVDNLVLTELGTLLQRLTTDPNLQAALKRAWAHHQPQPHHKHTAEKLQARIDTARASIDRATDLLIQRVIQKEAYDRAIQRAQSDADTARDELEVLRRTPAPVPLPPLSEVLHTAGSWATVLQGADVTAQRDVLAALVHRVVATREGRGRYRIAIAWTPLGQALQSA